MSCQVDFPVTRLPLEGGKLHVSWLFTSERTCRQSSQLLIWRTGWSKRSLISSKEIHLAYISALVTELILACGTNIIKPYGTAPSKNRKHRVYFPVQPEFNHSSRTVGVLFELRVRSYLAKTDYLIQYVQAIWGLQASTGYGAES